MQPPSVSLHHHTALYTAICTTAPLQPPRSPYTPLCRTSYHLHAPTDTQPTKAHRALQMGMRDIYYYLEQHRKPSQSLVERYRGIQTPHIPSADTNNKTVILKCKHQSKGQRKKEHAATCPILLSLIDSVNLVPQISVHQFRVRFRVFREQVA